MNNLIRSLIFVCLFAGFVVLGFAVPVFAADGATFVSETIPDNTVMNAGQGFTKTWTIRNSGTTTWNSNYKLRWVSGGNLSNHNDVAITSTVPPGGSYTFSVPMTAPGSGGSYREDWKLINGSATTVLIGSSNTIWVSIRVVSTGNSSLSGIVYAAGSGTVINGAEVRVGTYSSVTGANGAYNISSIPAGDYTATISKIGYITLTQEVRIPSATNVSRNFTLSTNILGAITLSNSYRYAGRKYFLEGINHNVTFNTVVNWNGRIPGKVKYETSKNIYDVAANSGGATKTINIGTEFNPCGKLKTTAINSDGTSSSSQNADFAVMPQVPIVPRLLAGLPSFSLVDKADNFDYETTSKSAFVHTVEFLSVSDINIPGKIPLIGETVVNLDYKFSFIPSIKSDGTVKYEINLERNRDNASFPKIKLGGFDYSLSAKFGAEGRYSDTTCQWTDWHGVFGFGGKVSVEKKYRIPQTFGIVYLAGRVGIEAEFETKIKNIFPLTFDGTPDVKLRVPITGIVGAGGDMFFAAEGQITGGADWKLLPQKEFKVFLEGSYRLVSKLFHYEKEGKVFLCEWSSLDSILKGCSWVGSASAAIESGKAQSPLNLVSRDYLQSPNYAKFSNRDSSVQNLAQQEVTMSGTTVIAPIQSTVFPFSFPSISSAGSNLYLAWLYDDPQRSIINRSVAVFSNWNGTSWSEPQSIEDDGTADFNPQVISFSDGAAIAVWEDAKKIFTESATESDLLSGVEIASSIYDPLSKRWTQTQRLTANNVLDRSPKIAGVNVNEALAAWISNENNDPTGSSAKPNVLWVAKRTGGTWGQPTPVANIPNYLLKYDLIYNGTVGKIVLSIDTDNDPTTEKDHELYQISYDNNRWGVISRLTNDSIVDDNPNLAFDAKGNILLVWLKGEEISSTNNLAMDARKIVTSSSYSTNLADFKLAVTPEGKVAIVWTDTTSQNTTDIKAIFYDQALDAWGNPLFLTNDQETEKYITAAFYGNTLTTAYNRTNQSSSTPSTFKSEQQLTASVPKPGTTDLYIMQHTVVGDLVADPNSFEFSPANPRSGEPVTLKMRLSNRGDTAASNILVTFYLGDPAAGGQSIGSTTITSTLRPGESSEATFNWTIPTTTTPLAIYAVVDPMNTFDDAFRSNNVVSKRFVKPDLAIQFVRSENVTDKLLSVSARVTNQGGLSTNQTSIVFRKNSEAGQILSSQSIPGLAPDQSLDVNFSLDVSGDASSSIVIFVKVDDNNTIDEFDESNNTSTTLARLVNITTPQSYTYSFPRGLNLVSFPFQPNVASMSDLLAPLGSDVYPYAYYLNDSGFLSAAKLQDLTAEPKKGYFLFLTGQKSVTLSGATLDSATEATTLRRGLNLVGVSQSFTPAANNNIYPVAYFLEGGLLKPVRLFETGLLSGKGYYIYALASNQVLTSNSLSLAPSELLGRHSTKALNTDSANQQVNVTPEDTVDFAAEFKAEQQSAPNSILLKFGIKPGSTDDFDSLDQLIFPNIGQMNGFLDDGLGESYKANASEKEWAVAIMSQIPAPGQNPNLNPVKLSWTIPSFGSLPTGAKFTLLDENKNVVIPDMKATTNAEFPVAEAGTTKKYIIRMFQETALPLTITTASPLLTGKAGALYSQSLNATGGITPYTWSVSNGTLPNGLSLSPAGTLNGTPAASGNFTFTIQVADNASLKTTKEFAVNIACPVITVNPSATPAGVTGANYTTTTFTAAGGAVPYTLSYTGTLPTGMSFANGVLSGTPTQSGSFQINIKATDANGCTGSRDYTLVIGCPTIIITPSTLSEGKQGTIYNQQLTASSGTAPYTFSLMSGSLPSGLNLSSNGVLSGTPTVSGKFSALGIKVTDANGCTATSSYTLIIKSACEAISISPTTLQNGIAGVVYNQTLTANGGTSPYSFNLMSGVLPTGIALSSSGVLLGAPSQIGSFPITIKVSDNGGCTGTRDYTLVIACADILLNSATLPSSVAGTAYNQTVTASGGTAPHTFSLSGTLPAGVTFSSGVLSGTPTQTGNFPIIITATDKNGCAGSKNYTLTISCPTITVNPATISAGTVGTVYNQTFTQTGGMGNVTFSLSGTLPNGMSFSGSTLSGIPSQSGNFLITIKITDANGCSGSRDYTLAIANPLPKITSINPAFKFAGDGAFALTVNGTGFVNGAKVRWNGNERNTTVVNDAQLTAAIPASDIVNAGSIQITVMNPSPGGGVSNALPFNIFVGYEADLSPRPDGKRNGTVTISDWIQAGRFIVGLDAPAPGSEFQRADSAPKATLGDGKITLADWVQAGRYSIGLDTVVAAGGPTSPVFGAVLGNVLSTDFRRVEAGTSPEGGTQNVFDAERTVRTINSNFTRGQIGTIQIALDAQGNENAVSFSLQFDPKAMSFVEATAGDGANGAAVIVNASQAASGRVGLAMMLPAGQQLAAGTRNLLNLRFIPNGGDGAVSTSVSFSDQMLAREVVDALATPIAQVSFVGSTVNISGKAVATVSAANYVGGEQAAESIVSAFGLQLSSFTQAAPSLPLPISLGGSQVVVKDSKGTERFAPLFYASPGQINFQIPAGTAEGIATLTIFSGGGISQAGLVMIGRVAPALFSADSTGVGFAAGSALTVHADGSRVENILARYDAATSKFIAQPIDIGGSGDQVYLTLYGTGIKNRSDLANVKVKIGGIDAQVEYAGAQGFFAGLDQINIQIPQGLNGRGAVNLEISVEGKTGNLTTVSIK